jgi:protein ImuB
MPVLQIMFACIHAKEIVADASLADFAYGFSPLVEETRVNTVVLDTAGCELLFGSAYELANAIAKRAGDRKEFGGLGCKVNVAVASNPDASIFAAHFYEGISFISPGEELTSLESLPLSFLKDCKTDPQKTSPIKIEDKKGRTSKQRQADADEQQLDEILETLRLWGVQTFGEFAALPVNGISERLGQAGVALQQLAAGKTERNLTLKQHPPVFAQSLDLDYPLTELEPLSFIFARLLNQLCATLNTYALATNELRVVLKLEKQEVHERVLNLPHPMRNNKIFLKLLLLETEMHPPASPVLGVSIFCEPVKPRFLQNGLFIPLAPEPAKLELTLLRLAKLLGPENVGAAELIDTHRRDAFLINKFVVKTKTGRTRRAAKPKQLSSNQDDSHRLLGFRVFRPALHAVVEAANGYPTQVSAWSKRSSVYGKVVSLAGPWRTTGDWWRADSWARDEWDVAIKTAREGKSVPALYRIYRELGNGSWFVEGSYD